MNKLSKRIIATGLCIALLAGGAGIGVGYALNSEQQETKQAEADATSVSAQQAENTGISKDESVYVLAAADGTVQKIIVSDWLRNSSGAAVLRDRSTLSDIENIKGDETYTLDGDSMKVWDAAGNDIYYQGNTEKELPVGLRVYYWLDGKPISAEELAGKSGKVKIRFDYENRQTETVTIDGKQESIYVPFTMMTGMLLDNDVFRDVRVSDGKLINDGERTAVIGFAMPGLQEDLALDAATVEIPDHVEITADVTAFASDVTVTIATNELFNELDTTKLNDAEDLRTSCDELTDAMEQLMDGSSALYDGLSTLLEKSDELVDGVNQLASGAKALKEGATSLDGGAAQLAAGLTELSGGLDKLSANNASISAGAKQVFDTLLATANQQLAAAGISVPKLTVENYAQVLNSVIASAGEKAGTSEGAKSLLSLKASLDGYNAFYRGLLAYTDGVASAADGAASLEGGAADLKDGTAGLKTGATTLYDGVLKLKDGMPALIDGVTALQDGTMQLSDGLKQLNEEGIAPLVDALGGDLDRLISRLRVTADVSRRYNNFSGISDDMDGTVRFVYRTEGINDDHAEETEE